MSNNSMVCQGTDGRTAEIGRAQWVQARAAQVTPEPAMNPVLLKPGSDRRSHVVVMGQPAGEVEATDFATGRRHLAAAAHAAYDDLASRFDVVVAEGAGSPTEINLRSSDYVNMGLARHADLPVVVVGDIDRGGLFASMFGTLALLEPADQALIAGFVVNKFRGDLGLLRPGLQQLETLTGRPVHGVLPWHPDLWLDSEDALDLEGRRNPESARIRVAVIRLPGSATSPTSTRSASNPLSTSSSSPTHATWRTPTSWCSPAPGRRCPTWPGCAPAGSTSRSRRMWPLVARCWGSVADSRCSAPRSTTRTGWRA